MGDTSLAAGCRRGSSEPTLLWAIQPNSALKHLALGGEWVSKRRLPLGRRTGGASCPDTFRLGRGQYHLLLKARRRILALAHGPPRP